MPTFNFQSFCVHRTLSVLLYSWKYLWSLPQSFFVEDYLEKATVVHESVVRCDAVSCFLHLLVLKIIQLLFFFTWIWRDFTLNNKVQPQKKLNFLRPYDSIFSLKKGALFRFKKWRPYFLKKGVIWSWGRSHSFLSHGKEVDSIPISGRYV